MNGEAIDEDPDFSNAKRTPELTLYLVQATRTESFEEAKLNAALQTVRDLLDLSKTPDQLNYSYSQTLVRQATIFRDAMRTLAGVHPQVSLQFVMASKGTTDNIHPNVRGRAKELEDLMGSLIIGSEATARFLGARELYELTGRVPSYTLGLRFVENQISAGNSYIVLSNLKDYYDFITDDTGNLRRYIFEWNVRDFQGEVEVNKDIKRTLEAAPGSVQFWWLNNGITILASKASIVDKDITLNDVQIVNGLQTSYRIHERISADPARQEERALLCRIIVTQDPETRDSIIKATNFQTTVSPVSLRAHDPIQRHIESFLLSKKWYYDRRKNYYKNLRKPADRIVSPTYLAQAIMAMGLCEPDNSRARPTSLIKDDKEYKRVFDESVALAVYLWAAVQMKRIDAFLRVSTSPGSDSEKQELHFHLAMWMATAKLGKRTYHPSQLTSLADTAFSDRQLSKGMKDLTSLLKSYPAASARPLDRIAKSREFVNYLLESRFGKGKTASGSKSA